MVGFGTNMNSEINRIGTNIWHSTPYRAVLVYTYLRYASGNIYVYSETSTVCKLHVIVLICTSVLVPSIFLYHGSKVKKQI